MNYPLRPATAVLLAAVGCGDEPPDFPATDLDSTAFCQLHRVVFALSPDGEAIPIPNESGDGVEFKFQETSRSARPNTAIAEHPELEFGADGLTNNDRRAYGPGNKYCFVASDTTIEERCAQVCQETVADESSRFPSLPGEEEPYCRSFPVFERQGDEELSKPGCFRVGNGNALPGSDFSPDLRVDIDGAGNADGVLSIGSLEGDVLVVDGEVSLELPDPLCEESGPCYAQINRLEIEYADFTLTANNAQFFIEDLTLALAGPLALEATPVPGTNSFLIVIPEGTELLVNATRDGSAQALPGVIPEAVPITYNPTTGELSLDFAFQAGGGDNVVSGSSFVTSNDVLNLAPQVDAGPEIFVVGAGPNCDAQVVLSGEAFDSDGNLQVVAWTAQQFLGRGESITATFPAGATTVRLTAVDRAGSIAFDDTEVHVSQGAPPVFIETPAAVEQIVCGQHMLMLPTPSAQAPCTTEAPDVEGRVVISNGQTVDIALQDGQVQLPPGEHVVLWTATNAHGQDTVSQHIILQQDPGAPIFSEDSPAVLTVHACELGPVEVAVQTPVAAAFCPPTVTGVLIESNSEPNDLVVNSPLTLAAGVHRVQWTAVNVNGLATIEQLIEVVREPTLLATDQVTIKNFVNVQNGSVANIGSGRTYVDTDAELGELLSVGPVDLRHRVRIHDSVLHVGPLTLGNSVEVDAGTHQVSLLPPVAAEPELPAFPGGPVVRVLVQDEYTLSPGDYSELSVEREARVYLSEGQYTFHRLRLEPGSTVVVSGGAEVDLFARDEFSFRGSITTESGDIAPILAGFAGQGEVKLERPFFGLFLAPYATLALETSQAPHRGRFFARHIDVRANTTVVHDALRCE